VTRLASNRLVSQLDRLTVKYFYGDVGTYYETPDAETGLDEYGQPPKAGAGISIMCSFNDNPAMEKWSNYADIEDIAGEVRFGTDITPDKGGQFQIEGRWDELTEQPQRFEIVGIRNRGLMGWVCLLKTVTI